MNNDNKNLDSQINSMLNSTQSIKPAKKKSKKKGFIILGVLVLGVAGYFAYSNFLMPKGPKAPMVEASKITKGDIDETLTVNGPIEGTDSVDITSGLHAKITELLVKEGDRVEKGVTVLAKIDPETIQKNIDNAKGNYDLKVAQKSEKIKNDRNSYAKAAAELEAAQKNYNRVAELVANGAAPQTDLDQAQATLKNAQIAVSAFNVKNGKVSADSSYDIDIANSKREVDSLTDQMKNTTLIAPITGTVTRVNTKVGQFADTVEDKSPLITIENLDELQMKLLVSEFNIGKISVGLPVTITADILGEGKSVKGEIISISPTGQNKEGGSGERVIPVKVKILDKDTKLISGITAKANILINSAKDTYLVPLSAIGDDGTGNRIMQFIVKNPDGTEKVTIKPVETGIENSTMTQLKSIPEGIDESNVKFVTSYDSSLTEGQTVMTSVSEDEVVESVVSPDKAIVVPVK